MRRAHFMYTHKDGVTNLLFHLCVVLCAKSIVMMAVHAKMWI